MKNITVIGAGNGGMTAAYHFAKEGHSVCIYDNPNFSTQIDAINTDGGITALAEHHGESMMFAGTEKIEKATTNIKEALEFSTMLVMICPSFAQEILFNEMLPYLTNDHKLVIMPGNYGGMVLQKIKNDAGKKELDIAFIDAISIPWACRIVSPGVISIMGIKTFLPMSIMPQELDTPELQKEIQEVFNQRK